MRQPRFPPFARGKSFHLRLAALVIPQQRPVLHQLAAIVQQDGAVHLPAGANNRNLRSRFRIAVKHLAYAVAGGLPP